MIGETSWDPSGYIINTTFDDLNALVADIAIENNEVNPEYTITWNYDSAGVTEHRGLFLNGSEGATLTFQGSEVTIPLQHRWTLWAYAEIKDYPTSILSMIDVNDSKFKSELYH